MKKRIIIISALLLFTTSCSCQYNLTIEDDSFNEKISIIADNDMELSSFNQNWTVPVNKEEYNIGLDPDSNLEYAGEIYDYNISNNILTFTHNFRKNDYSMSSAISNCYDLLTITDYGTNTIISSSSKSKCFEEHEELTSLTINIKLNQHVLSHDADNVNGNVYTWNIDSSNANKKGINITYENNNEQKTTTITTTTKKSNANKTKLADYELYILCGILLIGFLIGYFICSVIVKKSNKMDD